MAPVSLTLNRKETRVSTIPPAIVAHGSTAVESGKHIAIINSPRVFKWLDLELGAISTSAAVMASLNINADDNVLVFNLFFMFAN